MCGIGGILMFPQERTKQELAYIRKLAEGILVANDARGGDAAGIAVGKKDRTTAVFKYQITGEELTSTASWSDWVEENITNDTVNILLHTRAATQGSPDNNVNNHPIETYSTVGIHNGWIDNDDRLFTRYNMGRAGEVDSEVIFRLVDRMGLRLTAQKMASVANDLEGAFTFAFIRKFFPSQMWIVRDTMPIIMTYIDSLNIIIFASMQSYLTYGISCANAEVPIAAVNPADLTFIEPKRQAIYFFDTNADKAEEQLKQEPISFDTNFKALSAYGGYDPLKGDLPNGFDVLAHVTKFPSVLKKIEDQIGADDAISLHDLIESEKARAFAMGQSEGYYKREQEIEEIYSIGFENGFKKGYMKKAQEVNEGKESISAL